MSLRADLRNYRRLVHGLRSFLDGRISLDAARAAIRARLELREQNFLQMLERSVFGYAASPYRPLLAAAGVELGDIARLVNADGVDSTLGVLREAGVYVTFEEFKGRKPIVRGGRQLASDRSSFDNPFLKRHYETQTGGSTGPASRSSIDLDHLAVQATYLAVSWQAYGIGGLPKAVWRGLLPNPSGLNTILLGARIGDMPCRWFNPVQTSDLTSWRRYSLATYGILAIGRLHGVSMPWPAAVPYDRADVVARWAADAVRRSGGCYVATSASQAVRVCEAARELGLDLRKVVFSGGGEPLTPAKAAEINRAGAQCRPTYFTVETGAIGMSCADPIDADDHHFFEDAIAMIQCPRRVAGWDLPVNSFHVTSLLPAAPKVLLNVELDDFGIVDRRACGCAFEALGFTTHIRQIRSFSKLTSEGVTLVANDMLEIIEQVLPARFGGTSLDYQLLEEEDSRGLTRLSLLVSPRIHIEDEQAVANVVLAALEKGGVAQDHTKAIWRQAGTLQVQRREPQWTAGGKLLPLQLALHASASEPAAASKADA